MLLYYYQTNDLFAEEPVANPRQVPEMVDDNEQFLTLEALEKERGEKRRVKELLEKQEEERRKAAEQEQTGEGEGGQQGGMGGLEEEAGQQGAFNPETGEINWDCPCLGGMATGPCGEEFKAAFSCFVYSTEEPKGMDCIEKFKGMQNCFREYPEIYGAELQEDDEDAENEGGAVAHAENDSGNPLDKTDAQPNLSQSEKVAGEASNSSPQKHEKQERAKAATEQVQREHEPEPVSEAAEVIPKEWHDTKSSSGEKKEHK